MTAEASGSELLDLIRSRWELEWWRYSPRRSRKIDGIGKVSLEECESLRPPSTSFRFKEERPDVIAALQAAVSSYGGRVKWVMFSHDRAPLAGRNWVIMPGRVAAEADFGNSRDTTLGELFESQFPEFGSLCFQDLPGLVDHIRGNVGPAMIAAPYE